MQSMTFAVLVVCVLGIHNAGSMKLPVLSDFQEAASKLNKLVSSTKIDTEKLPYLFKFETGSARTKRDAKLQGLSDFEADSRKLTKFVSDEIANFPLLIENLKAGKLDDMVEEYRKKADEFLPLLEWFGPHMEKILQDLGLEGKTYDTFIEDFKEEQDAMEEVRDHEKEDMPDLLKALRDGNKAVFDEYMRNVMTVFKPKFDQEEKLFKEMFPKRSL